MTTIQKLKWIVIGMFTLFILAYAFSSDTSETTTPTPIPTPTIAEDSTSAKAFKDIYMEECDSENNNTEYCSCTYNYLLKEVGLKGVLQIGMDLDENGEVSDELVAALENCIHLYNE